jgi:N-acetylglucosamine-6-sulfatase
VKGGLGLALAAALLGLVPAAAAAEQAQSTPNVVVVMTDDQSVSDVRRMPNVRRLLARRGTTFSNSFSSYPLCCPSRATFLTGQYAHNHGVDGNFAPSGYYGFRGRRNTLPVWLDRAGYRTVHVGKYLNQYGALDPREVPPGWDEWYGGVDFSTYDYFNYLLNHNGRVKAHGDADYARALLEINRATQRGRIDSSADLLALVGRLFTPGDFGAQRARDYQTDVLARIAAGFVRRSARSERPFFLSFAPVAPHREDINGVRPGAPGPDPRPAPRHASRFAQSPLPRRPSFNEADVSDKPALIRAQPRLTQAQIADLRRDHRGRLGSLQAVDEAVGRLVATLRRAGELDETLILFTSDNGWTQGEHRVPDNKYVAYEESIRVPLIIRGPEVPAGQVIDPAAINVDLAATIVDAANARPGRRLDGISLLPIAREPASAARRDVALEALAPLFAGRGFPYPFAVPYYGVRTERFKYVRWSYGDEELYDLRADPYELRNLAADRSHAELKAELAARARRLRRCVGAACR